MPIGLLVGALAILVACDLTFFGVLFPRQPAGTGIAVAAAGVAAFLLGRGTVIDGSRQTVRRWWGWLYRPVLTRTVPFAQIDGVEIRKTLGYKDPDPTVGRTVRYPLFLLRSGATPILIKPCPWVSEARFIAEELSVLMSVPTSDLSGELEDPDEREH